MDKTKAANEIKTDILRRISLSNNGDKYSFRVKGKTFQYWFDYPNDVWCLIYPDGTIEDYSYFDDIFDASLAEY